jgi:hypothetical protein
VVRGSVPAPAATGGDQGQQLGARRGLSALTAAAQGSDGGEPS